MISEKPSTGVEMSNAAYAQELVFRLAAPPELGDSQKGQIDRAYRRLMKALKENGRDETKARWTWRRVKAFWYGEAPDHTVRTWQTQDLELAVVLHEARKAHAEFRAETERLAAYFSHADEDFGRAEIEGRRSWLGGVHRARADGGDE